MKTHVDECIARNAWQLWKSITQLDTMVWELFGNEFLDFIEEEDINRVENYLPDL